MQTRKLSYSDNLDLWFLRLEVEGTRNNIVNMIDTAHLLYNHNGITKFLEMFNVLISKFDMFYSLVKEHALVVLEPTDNFIDYEINFITREFKVWETEQNFELKEQALNFIGFAGDYVSIVDDILAGRDVL